MICIKLHKKIKKNLKKCKIWTFDWGYTELVEGEKEW